MRTTMLISLLVGSLGGCVSSGEEPLSQSHAFAQVACCAVLLHQEPKTETSDPLCNGDQCLRLPKILSPPSIQLGVSNLLAAGDDGANAAESTPPQEIALPAAKEIIIYSRDKCEACDYLQHELRQRGLAFELRDADPSEPAPYGSVDGVEVRGNQFYRELRLPIPTIVRVKK